MNRSFNINDIQTKILISLVLILAILIAYLKIGDLAFVDFDDPLYITENRMVYRGLSVESLVWAFTTFHGSNWHPLTWLSHMFDCQLYGIDPRGHHWTSLQLHIANTLILFFLLHKITGTLRRSAIVALLFAVHPLNVESVAWIAERKNVLSSFFGLLMIYAYARYVEEKRLFNYLLVFIFLGLGLMAKPMLVTFPFVLLLLDFWPLKRLQIKPNTTGKPGWYAHFDVQTAYGLIREKIPLFILVGLSSILTIIAESSMGAVKSLGSYSITIRLANAFVSYCLYVIKAVFPMRLSFFYPHPGPALPLWKGWAAALLIFAVSYGVIRSINKYPYLTVGWFWYLGTLIPVIGLVQTGSQSMADRYTYVPLIGIFIITTWGIFDMAVRRRWRKTVLALCGGLVLAAYTGCTWYQVGIWRNSVTLFTYGLRVTPDNWRAHYGIGRVFEEQGKLDQATLHYAKALQIFPQDASTHNNFGNVLTRQGKFKQAIDHYHEALKIDPEHSNAHNNLGVVLADQQKFKEAQYHFRKAIANNPENDNAYINLANLLTSQGQPDQAVRHYKQALQIKPDNANLHKLLGLLLVQEGKVKEALMHFSESIAIQPDDATAYNEVGIILARQKNYEEAERFFQKALQLNPADGGIRKNYNMLKQVLTSSSTFSSPAKDSN